MLYCHGDLFYLANIKLTLIILQAKEEHQLQFQDEKGTLS